MFIKFTHVDAVTGVSVFERPASNGPALPAVAGIAIRFANESEWPSPVPIFYGECDDGADVSVPGVLAILTQDEFDAAKTAELQARGRLEQKALEAAVQQHLDNTAQAHGYDDIRSAALRASLPDSPYYSDGVLFGEWMDAVWYAAFEIQSAVTAGTREKPSLEMLIAELPPLPTLS